MWQPVIIRHVSGTYMLVGITTSIFADKKLPPNTSTIHYTRSYEHEDGGDEQKTEKNGRVLLEKPGPRRGSSAVEGMEWHYKDLRLKVRKFVKTVIS